jgi:glycosyltransferase involved in cell wall biosynthesis
VERGTLEVSRHLVSCGHQSLVVSHGGRLVPSLQKDGGIHITLPVHKKRLGSLRQVGVLRELFDKEKPDIVHARSRVPAWLAWLAWRKLDQHNRPRFLTTFHGFYSVNFYSKIMTRGEKIIAVSHSVKDFILRNYPSVREEQIVVIHRGIDPRHFPRGFQPDPSWLATWQNDFPELQDKQLLLMPGRITRWKGQQDFLQLIASRVRTAFG